MINADQARSELQGGGTTRLVWADAAKGVSILLVVFGHAVLAVDQDLPLGDAVTELLWESLTLVRMPTFFLISGMLAARTLERDRRSFIDRTILQLVWVFLVWNGLQALARLTVGELASTEIATWKLALFPVYPLHVNWFIWALLIYYVVMRALRSLPAALLLTLATLLFATEFEIAHPINRTLHYFVFFAAGVMLSGQLPALIGRIGLLQTLLLGTALAPVSLLWVALPTLDVPLIEAAFTIVGIMAVLGCCAQIAGTAAGSALAWLGGRTLPVFVAHYPIVAATREAALAVGLTESPALLIALCTMAGIALPLVGHALAPRLGFGWLFRKPAALTLERLELGRAGVSAAGRQAS